MSKSRKLVIGIAVYYVIAGGALLYYHFKESLSQLYGPSETHEIRAPNPPPKRPGVLEQTIETERTWTEHSPVEEANLEDKCPSADDADKVNPFSRSQTDMYRPDH